MLHLVDIYLGYMIRFSIQRTKLTVFTELTMPHACTACQLPSQLVAFCRCASSAINLHKAGIYIEAEAEVKFMLLLQNLFTLKQKYGGRIVTAVNQLQYIHLAIGLHSINERLP